MSSLANQSLEHPAIHDLLQIDAGSVTTLVDHGVEIEGVVRNKSQKAILISGKVIGSIESTGAVIINEGAEVVGSIKASALQIGGTVTRGKPEDRLNIVGAMVVAKGAHMGCDAECAGVQLEFGATIDGSIRPRAINQQSDAESSPGVVRAIHTGRPSPAVAAVAPTLGGSVDVGLDVDVG